MGYVSLEQFVHWDTDSAIETTGFIDTGLGIEVRHSGRIGRGLGHLGRGLGGLE